MAMERNAWRQRLLRLPPEAVLAAAFVKPGSLRDLLNCTGGNVMSARHFRGTKEKRMCGTWQCSPSGSQNGLDGNSSVADLLAASLTSRGAICKLR
eukprot:CAMPEP_0169350894 /NCGR_PEP_ID=MMETSP1017-20121227/24491_1 /TAXON_ID=342587 /ORGANISM="Karlodinium micrum, Strain CCMP2283" /LENGTH=95 /DNA_ID=CAMNT_0009447123 /DNA_START=986 /DNA_END=1271 /DNA_ORIENTATION=+